MIEESIKLKSTKAVDFFRLLKKTLDANVYIIDELGNNKFVIKFDSKIPVSLVFSNTNEDFFTLTGFNQDGSNTYYDVPSYINNMKDLAKFSKGFFQNKSKPKDVNSLSSSVTISMNPECDIVIDKHGNKRYYKNGKLHRLGGPAVETYDGKKEYWVNGKEYNFNDYRMKNNMNESRSFKAFMLEAMDDVKVVAYLKKPYNPSVRFKKLPMGEYGVVIGGKKYIVKIIDKYGSRVWTLNGMKHRENGPAIENEMGNNIWYIKDKKHRLDGPAEVHGYSSSFDKYWIDGKQYSKDEFEKKTGK